MVDRSGPSSAAFKRRFLTRLVAVLCGGMFLDGYILGIIGTVIGRISADLHFTPIEEGLLASSAMLGILVGSPLGGWASDKYGRKPLFVVDMLMFFAASALQFVVTSPVQLLLVRGLMGLAIGAEYSVGWPLMCEFSPARLRGRLLGFSQIAWYVGFMVAFLVGYTLTTATHVGWRFVLGTSTFLAGALLVARVGLPESPRWLWDKGRREDARLVARRYLEHFEETPPVAHAAEHQGGLRMLFSRRYWRTTVFVSVFWFCAVAPYFAIATFAASVLEGYGLSGGLIGGVGLSALAAIGVITCVIFIERVGRRTLTVLPQWICTVLLAVIGVWTGAPAVVVLLCFLAFSYFNAMYNTLTGIYPGELFPTEVRGLGTGFAAAFSRLGAGAGTLLLPWSMDNLGAGATMMIASLVVGIGAAVSHLLAPETKGMSLAEAAAGYGH